MCHVLWKGSLIHCKKYRPRSVLAGWPGRHILPTINILQAWGPFYLMIHPIDIQKQLMGRWSCNDLVLCIIDSNALSPFFKSMARIYFPLDFFFLYLHINKNFTTKPFPKRQILDSSKLKEFADDNFRFDGNVRKLSKRVENTVGKEEIARYEQFLLLSQCFQKTRRADMWNQGLFGKRLNNYILCLKVYKSDKILQTQCSKVHHKGLCRTMKF